MADFYQIWYTRAFDLGVAGDPQPVDYGVIQGSTLGPILFLIYINNISKTNIKGKLFLFADDALVFVQGKNWLETKNNALQSLMILKKWFDQNLLSLNITKTKFMTVSLSKLSDYNLQNLVIHNCGNYMNSSCECKSIEKVNNYKYLGIVFDTRMTWELHINLLTKKLRQYFFAFKQLREILDSNEIKLVYYGYIQSILTFGNIAWGGAHTSVILPLFVAQKKILKIAFKKPLRYPTSCLFEECSVFSIKQLYVKSLLIHIFCNYQTLYSEVSHSYNTRYSQNVGVTALQLSKSFSKTCSYYLCNILYRNICQFFPNYRISMFDSPSLPVFKKQAKQWILHIGLEGAESIVSAGFRPVP